MEGWNATQPNMPNLTFMEAQKYQKVLNSQEKIDYNKRDFSRHW